MSSEHAAHALAACTCSCPSRAAARMCDVRRCWHGTTWHGSFTVLTARGKVSCSVLCMLTPHLPAVHIVVVHPCRTLLSRYPQALVVPDLTQDVRFKDSPIVTEWPRARFYAACPLVAHTGTRLGTL